jgi:SAM-dependent methyltransferase
MDFEAASSLFDLYVDWSRRLAREMPYLQNRIGQGHAKVADVACGSGYHACALAQAGFGVTAIDPDPVLLEKSRARAESLKVDLTLVEAPFAGMPDALSSTFDGAVCLGNSISLVAPGEDLLLALQGLSRILKPGGKLILHTLNYPMLAQRSPDPWGPVRILDDDTLLLKGFIPRNQGAWDAMLILLKRSNKKGWERTPIRFSLHPHPIQELKDAAGQAGLEFLNLHGGFQDESFDHPDSADLVYEFLRHQDP